MPTRQNTRAALAALALGAMAVAALFPGWGSPAQAGVPKVVMVEDFTATW